MEVFTDQLHAAASDLWQKGKDHPFVHELQSGQLPLSKFRFYLLQDRYYLDQFAQVHEMIVTKADNKWIADFIRTRAQDLRDTEISVRTHFFEELTITPQEAAQTPVAPTAYDYVNHLHMTLNVAGIAPAVAAIVPCYWLYQEIGQKMAATGSPVHYYQEWIDTYDGDWYGTNVTKILELTNVLAKEATSKERQEMVDAFVRSSYYELQFWQMAYEEQGWK